MTPENREWLRYYGNFIELFVFGSGEFLNAQI